ncbi:hypothetical protein FIBSPDRAFT_813236 [Athelia psychrophila]|uniref:Uncharacterized protein n=1 Tax=Athelia psychrophila TaxID=1759441 RepID=A0A166UGG0_9AGAM|nr:hypothetical protein FIBSPDRAFT_813236 [Fibularhizoctonia sp. CBS 109695]
MLRRCMSTVLTLGGSVNPPTRSTYSTSASHSAAVLKKITYASRRTSAARNSLAPQSLASPEEPNHVNNTPRPEAVPSHIELPCTHIHTSATPLESLRQFLSQSPNQPVHYDASTLSTHFTSLVDSGQLGTLPHAHLSALISIFGTLSIYPTYPTSYSHPCAANIRVGARQKYWAFVSRLRSQVESLGAEPTHSDRYWAMRSHIAVVANTVDGTSRHDAMACACDEYARIREDTAHPDVHAPYLEALLSMPGPAPFQMAVAALCEVLGTDATGLSQDRRMQAILRCIVLQSGHAIADEWKEALLSACVKLARRQAEAPSQLGRESSAASDVDSLADLMTDATLLPAGPLPSPPTRAWAHAQAHAAFVPSIPLAQRWNSLVLLSLFHAVPTSDRARLGSVLQGGNERLLREAAATGWHVVLVLAIINKLFRPSPTPCSRADEATIRSLEGVGKALWTHWRAWAASGGAQGIPVHVSRIVAAAFFRLAAITEDVSLAAATDRHSTSAGIWRIQAARDAEEVKQIADLATEYIAASLACETESLDHLLAELHVSYASCWGLLIVQIYENLCKRDALLAGAIHERYRTELPMESNHALALSLAQHGQLTMLPAFARDDRINAVQTRELLTAVLLSIAECQNTLLHPAVAAMVGTMMKQSYASSPPLKQHRAIVQHGLTVLVSSHHAQSAAAAFESIYLSSIAFFSSQFILRFMPALVKHRQHSAVARIVEALGRRGDRVMPPLRTVVLVGLTRGGASTLAARVDRATMRWRRRDTMVRAARAIRFRMGRPAVATTLRISSQAPGYITDGPAVQFAMRILLRGGRTAAAAKLFRQTDGQLAAPMRTSLGNVIIDRYARSCARAGARQMRKVLSVYKFLVSHGLVSDRITVNTLIKAILRWRNAMDKGKLKVLFDHMVRHGYPGGAGLAKGDVPFGTSTAEPVFRLPTLDGGMTFEKHTRPLLKMFIKAFFVRGDVMAAKRVIQILKEEETAVMAKRDKKRRAKKAKKVWIRPSSGGS